ncbi:MAG TPA: hypothetical protein VKU39_22155 [Streptosporangiaceae bacterium]|nr:hypothetical protein [Streptosporangiaceae bacterium]
MCCAPYVLAAGRARDPAVLAIDGGNSKTDVALVAYGGTLLATVRGPGINPQDVGADQTALNLDALVRQAAGQAGLSASRGWIAEHTVACLANADLPEEKGRAGRRGAGAGVEPDRHRGQRHVRSCARA